MDNLAEFYQILGTITWTSVIFLPKENFLFVCFGFKVCFTVQLKVIFIIISRYLVIDEAHAYKGAFGCHTALILRRFRRLCSHGIIYYMVAED